MCWRPTVSEYLNYTFVTSQRKTSTVTHIWIILQTLINLCSKPKILSKLLYYIKQNNLACEQEQYDVSWITLTQTSYIKTKLGNKDGMMWTELNKKKKKKTITNWLGNKHGTIWTEFSINAHPVAKFIQWSSFKSSILFWIYLYKTKLKLACWHFCESKNIYCIIIGNVFCMLKLNL